MQTPEDAEVIALTKINLINNSQLYEISKKDDRSVQAVLQRQGLMNQHYILLNLLQMRGVDTTAIREKCNKD